MSSSLVTLTPRRTVGLILSVVLVGAVSAACSSSGSSSSASSGSSSASGAAASSSAKLKGTPIKIGAIVETTGVLASSNSQGATVGPAWQDWVNSNGGISGHPVQVIVKDDGDDPAKAQAAYQSLASQGVVAIAVTADNTVSAYDNQAVSAGIPLVSGTVNLPDWFTKAGMFPTPGGNEGWWIEIVHFARKYAKATKIANLYCSEVPTCAAANPVFKKTASSLGMGFTAVSASDTTASYTAQCLSLQQQKVDFVIVNLASQAAIQLMENCQAQGYNPTWAGESQATSPSFEKVPNLTYYIAQVSFPVAADAKPASEFRAAMQKYAKGGNWQGGTATTSWDALQTIRAALLADPSAKPSAATTMSGLYTLTDSNLGGELANQTGFTTGKPTGAHPCIFLAEIKNGKISAPQGLAPQCPAG
jgi:branched-chain amino acid transport system substrate-binding protein